MPLHAPEGTNPRQVLRGFVGPVDDFHRVMSVHLVGRDLFPTIPPRAFGGLRHRGSWSLEARDSMRTT